MPDGFSLELDIEGFRAWTEMAVKEVESEAAGKALRALTLEFIRRVVEKTPVDFGRARAGWTSFAVHLGSNVNLGGSGAKAAEQAKGLAEGSFSEHLKGSDQFIEIINGVSYIVMLEFGSSDQAPGGMMRITFKEMMGADTMTKEIAKELQRTYTKVNQKLRVQRVSKQMVD